MAALDDLISQIPDESLRERIRAEMKRANRQKKFGLVFEEHLPEATPLYDIPVALNSFMLSFLSVINISVSRSRSSNSSGFITGRPPNTIPLYKLANRT